VLVGIDDNRIDAAQGIERSACFITQSAGQCEVAAISGIGMDAHARVPGAYEDIRQRVDVTEAGRAHRRDDRADVATDEQVVEVREVHVARGRATDR